ncbi:MAG TPA: hypothetical protein VKE40_00255 [Gemmataceae bacterium]|nr:hypothetical protein [Gemmataceae bacterium]
MTERDLFLAVVDIPDPTERIAYLDRECAGDTGLRDRAAELLRAHEESGAFMNHPAGAGTVTGPVLAAELVGSRVGPFKLLQVIGEGGFGVVYMAEQEQPVSRRVALSPDPPFHERAHSAPLQREAHRGRCVFPVGRRPFPTLPSRP